MTETQPQEAPAPEQTIPEQPPAEQPADAPRERGPGAEGERRGPRGPRGPGGPGGRRRHRRDEAEEGEKDFRRRRQRGDKKAQEQVKGFVSMFEGAGLSEDRMAGMRKVPAARKILEVSRTIGHKCGGFTKTVNEKTKAQLDALNEKYDEEKKEIPVHPSILIGLMTLAVAFEAARGVITNMIQGLVEAVMKVSSAFSDALQDYYRDKFSAKNDYQEISIAIVLFVATIYSSIVGFISTVCGTIKTGIVQLLLQLFGKDFSNCISHVLSIFGIWFQLHLLLSFMTFKYIFWGIIILVILSFFMKMDDLPEEKAEKEAAEKKEGEAKEGEASSSSSEAPAEQPAAEQPVEAPAEQPAEPAPAPAEQPAEPAPAPAEGEAPAESAPPS